MIEHRKLWDSFGHAFRGLKFALSQNQNLRIHLWAGTVVIVASIFLGLSSFEMSILGVMILLVIAAEMINTSLEEMVNLITKEHRAEAKIAKDVAAGMVLVASMGSIIVGALIFLPHIKRFF